MDGVTVYGIANCDTVRRARAWLAAHGIDAPLHDVRKAGLPPELLDRWLGTFGWERLLNRQGTTWRRLDEATRTGVADVASARALMLAQPSVMRRPVVRWADDAWTLGFDPEDWARRV